jgi:hypothetical protein
MTRLLLIAAHVTTPGVRACSVCFGGGDSVAALSRGIWWGIIVLLTVTLSLVGAIGWTIWRVECRRVEKNA